MPNRTSKHPKQLPSRSQTTRILTLNKTPNIEYGQLASSLCFELAKKLGQKPLALAEQLVAAMDKSTFYLIEKVAPAGAGYINFHVKLRPNFLL